MWIVELSISGVLSQLGLYALTSDPAVKCECNWMHIFRVACLFICVWHFKPPHSKNAKHFFPWISLLLLCYHLAHGWTTLVSPSWTKLLFYTFRISWVWMQKKGKARELEVKSNPFSKQQKGQCWRSPRNRLPSLKTIFLSGWILFVAFLPVYWLPQSKTRLLDKHTGGFGRLLVSSHEG